MAAAKTATYNNGEEFLYALVVSEADHRADLIVFDGNTGASSLVRDVPKRAKKDYGDEGGGRTYDD